MNPAATSPTLTVVTAMVIEQFVAPFVAAVAYSLYTYSGKYVKNGDKFLPKKFLRTLLIGVFTGLVVAGTGQQLTLNNFEAVAASVGAVHVADVAVGAIWEKLVQRGIIPKYLSSEIDV